MSGWMHTFTMAAVPLTITAILAVLLGIWIGRGLRRSDPAATAAVAPDDTPTAVLPVAAPAAPDAAESAPQDGPEEPTTFPEQPDLAEQLVAAEERIAVLAGRLESENKRHQIEFGRLESGALAALDGAIAKGNARAIELGDALDEMRKRSRLMQGQIEYWTRRSETLEQFLSERDARLAEITAELDNSRREQ
ncbi:hypothetical protein [Millisia brevis]|uniref:hypothetical protein n=1 Tax=Millisia brevis TaxID=264148 RepID=UPI00082F0DCD|nr:hypothetical protein [Millisia brevis]